MPSKFNLRLPATVWILGFISLINDASSELIYPLLPLYLTTVLMAGPKALGLIEGIAEMVGSLLKLFSGIIIDKTGKNKPWVIFGYSLSSFAKPALGLVFTWPMVLMLRFFDRLGKGLRTTPRDAIIASSVPLAQRGLAFGLQRALDNAGAVIGPLIAAFLLFKDLPYQNIFLWTLVPALFCITLTFFIKDSHQKPLNTKFSWRLAGFPSSFKRYILVIALFNLGNSSNMFLLLRAHDLGLAPYQIPLIWACTSLIAMLFSVPLSALSDLIGRKRLIIGGWLVYGLFYLLMGLGKLSMHLWALWILFAIYGLFLAATEGAEKAYVADLAEEKLLGTAYGWFNLTVGIMLLPASLIFGWLWQSFSPHLAFSVGGSAALLSAFLLKVWVKA